MKLLCCVRFNSFTMNILQRFCVLIGVTFLVCGGELFLFNVTYTEIFHTSEEIFNI